MAFLNQQQLEDLNLKFLGRDVKISDKASLYGNANIEIGDNSRIDDFCILSAGEKGIKIGRYVHIACHSSLIGSEEIIMEDFSAVSSKVSIYSSSDDFSGNFLTNPTVPVEYKNVQHGAVKISKHVIVGAGAVVLPNVIIAEGVAIGAMSFVTRSCKKPFKIYSGIPAKSIKDRSMELIKLEELLEKH